MYYSVFQTSAGWVGLEFSELGLRRLVLPAASKNKIVRQLKQNLENGLINRDYPGDLTDKIRRYFEGNPVRFDCKLDLSGATDFQCAVWKTTRNIPRGQVKSYHWVAVQLGKSRAARAVGQALAKNPLPLIIPCHRVIYNNGKAGGFSARSNIADIKLMLLRLEGVDIASDSGDFS
ncbi:MAG: methylated-DNA--[protein]-cysteine S-methyltransferase [Dehalococcoidia bacterium]|nr:methylated-DNA--[protein]-cysteine S-methyltransferase [Dehalococcoidia bacterium]MDD5495004.1 methylated-DNA--[protein]-cysteine S-methyltransferase [Dehalococcoidia bacterium]